MKSYKNFLIPIVALIIIFAIGIIGLRIARAATVINLGSADSFAVLAGSTISATNPSAITGNVGLSPAAGSFITGILSTNVTGTIYAVDASGPAGSVNNPTLLTAAKNALTSAYLSAEASIPAVTLVNPDLGGQTFTSGTYYSAAAIHITGTTTLDAEGDPNAVFIFQADSTTLTTESNSYVDLINGAQACNVFWQIGSSATFGTYSDFKGNVLAFSSITDSGGSTIEGRLLARNAAVTLNNTTLTKATCSVPPAPATITITKTVNNNYGGTKVVADFPLFFDGNSITSGVATTTLAGHHTISETSDAGYTAVIGGDCADDGTIDVVSGSTVFCTITNSDIAPQLTITKTVNNNYGGTKTTSSFSYFIDGVTTTLGVASTTSVGLHTVSESADSGYLSIIGGDCSLAGTTTLALGESKTCTITNSDIAPRLVVIKTVVNDDTGVKVISDFPLFVDGVGVTSSVTGTVSLGLHTVSETSDSGYTSTIGGDCSLAGTTTLALGDIKICIITNNDIAPPSGGSGSGWTPPVPPLIDVVKVPSPLALPDGPGVVVYNYTLNNVGTVPVVNITMVDDSCTSTSYVSGDTNNDSKLDVNETWIYKCSTTISKTHTNTVIATGWANGISATDVANATVIVGHPVVPPLIHVTKVPNPLLLSVGGGIVTYTNKVTNPGTVALSNVNLTDDKCEPVKYISGDTNNDLKLDTTETWIFTCQAELSDTTVNTVTASGKANGLIAKDFAIVTVVVASISITPVSIVTAIPTFPNVGFPPVRNNALWGIIILASIMIIISIPLVIFIKKRTS